MEIQTLYNTKQFLNWLSCSSNYPQNIIHLCNLTNTFVTLFKSCSIIHICHRFNHMKMSPLFPVSDVCCQFTIWKISWYLNFIKRGGLFRYFSTLQSKAAMTLHFFLNPICSYLIFQFSSHLSLSHTHTNTQSKILK